MVTPTLTVEIGFNGAGNNTYLLFDDTTRGKFGTGTFAAGVYFTDVTSHVVDVTIDRGRSRPLETFKPGTCTITLDNTSGDYDPHNLSGPYVAAGTTQVLPMVPVRVRATVGGTTYDLYYGYVDKWRQNQRGVATAQTVVTCTDGMKILAAYEPGATSNSAGGGEDTGARVGRILNLVGIPAGDRDLDVGDSTLQATMLAGNVLTQIDDAVRSEQGYFWVAPNGKYTFRNRTSRYGTFITGLIGGGGGVTFTAMTFTNVTTVAEPVANTYETVELSYDDELIKNAVGATRTGGTLQPVSDSASVARYTTKSHNVADLWLETDLAALNWANQILVSSKDAEQRVDKIVVAPAIYWTADRWQTLLGMEFGATVQVTYRPVAGDDVVVILFYDGIHVGVRDGTLWDVEMACTSTSGYDNPIVFQEAAVPGSGFDAFQFTF